MIAETTNEYLLKVIKIILYKTMCPQRMGGEPILSRLEPICWLGAVVRIIIT